MLGEKRLVYDPQAAEDPAAHMPVFTDLDGTVCEGLWAIVDHLEGAYPEQPLMPEDAMARGEALRWLDWCMSTLADRVTKKIIYEKANPRFTGGATRSTPDMNIIRGGREALREMLPVLGKTVEERGSLGSARLHYRRPGAGGSPFGAGLFRRGAVGRQCAIREWYVRMKSRPSFRSLLADRVPGQPPVSQYAELDF